MRGSRKRVSGSRNWLRTSSGPTVPSTTEASKQRDREMALQRYYRNREKRIAQAKEWREANRDRVRETDNRRRQADLPKYNERQRRWRSANPEKASAQFRTWRERNPDAVAAMARRRRARVRGAPGTVTAKEWQELLEEFDYRCAYCNRDELLEMDHMMPISRGGHHTKENVVPACVPCNRSKGALTPLEFIGTRFRMPL